MCDDAMHLSLEAMLKSRGGIAPSGIYLRQHDGIRLTAYSSVASLVVELRYLLLNEDGNLISGAISLAPTSDRAATSTTQHVGGGFLISAAVVLASGSAKRGQCYVKAQVVVGQGAAAVAYNTIVSEYVSTTFQPSYPGTPVRGALEGPGYLRSVTGTDPAAGAEVTEAVPTGARWRLISLKVLLTASAQAANRRTRFLIDDGTTIYFRTRSATDQTANQAIHHTFATVGDTLTTSASTSVIASPGLLYLPAGHRILTDTFNLDVGDDYGAPQMLVEEWIEA